MDDLPPLHSNPPQDVEVKNWPPRPSPAADYFHALDRRYKEFQQAANEHQIAVMRYYTPTGGEIRIANVSRHRSEETILLQGEDEDKNPCDVVVLPQNAQIVLKLITKKGSEDEQPVLKIENKGVPESETPNTGLQNISVNSGVYRGVGRK